MIKTLKRNYLLVITFILLLCFSLVLRVVNLSEYPVGFQIDEASLGYNAYSILHTGKSEAGIKFPLYIDTFGDNRPTGYNYLAIPSVAVFGLTVFATRLPGALFGAFLILPVWVLSFSFFKNKRISFLASTFSAISPWGIVLSRASAETVIALFFILLGFGLTFHFVRTRKTWELVIGILSLGLSFFFYHTPRVFVPMYFFVSLLVLCYPYKNLKGYKELSKLAISFLFLCVLSFTLIFIVKGGTGRFSQVNIFGFPETKLTMEEQIREDGAYHASSLESRMLHNKIVNYSLTFASNYFAYFSGDFLFMHGGLPAWYKVDQTGLILLSESPFILYGIYLCFKSKNRFGKLPLFWILVAPVTAAITVDDIPNLQRVIVLFPILEIFAAVGLVGIIDVFKKQKKILMVIFAFLVLLNFSYFLHQYFVHGKYHQTWFRNNGFGAMMNLVNESIDTYDHVVLTKTEGGYPLVLFFAKYSPEQYIREGSPKDADYKGFGKFIFVPQGCPSINGGKEIPSGKNLFVDREDCKIPKNWQRKYVDIHKDDGSQGFRVVY